MNTSERIATLLAFIISAAAAVYIGASFSASVKDSASLECAHDSAAAESCSRESRNNTK